MFIDIKFTRPIVRGIDYISPGGYEVRSHSGKEYQFDFLYYYGEIDRKDPTILHAEMRKFDTTAFSYKEFQCEKGLPEAFIDIEAFGYHVYVADSHRDDEAKPSLNPLKLLHVTFAFENGTSYTVPAEICRNAYFC